MWWIVGLSLGQVKPKTIKLIFVASSTSMHHLGVSACKKNIWLEIRIMCISGVICLPAGCCFSELAL